MEKSKVISGLFWKFAERIGAQGVNLIVSIVLARLIAPAEYGLIALITIFINISNVFIESGMGTALIQKKNADDIDFSSVFYFNIVMSIIMYVILFLFAPLIAKFYNNESLVLLVRILGLTLLIAGVKSIQHAYVSRNMMFKKFFFSTLFGTVFSAILGIIMAYKGFGVWALVTQQMTNTLVDTIVLWITVKWRPKLIFSFKRVKGLFSYGWKLLCSSLLDTTYNNLYGLVIGKVYSPSDLAYYNKGNQFPSLIVTNINGSIQSVMLPALAQEQDNKEKIKSMMRRSIKTSTFIITPLLLGLAAVADIVIILLLTDKWLPSVPLLQLLCLSYMFWPIHTVNLQAINAIGRSDIFLKLEIIKKIIGVIALLISIPFGITVMVSIQVLTSLISMFINSYPNKKLLNYSFFEQIKDILPAIIISGIMFAIVWFIKLSALNLILQLIIKILIGGVTYIILAKIFRLEAFEYVIEIIKNFIEKKFFKNKEV